MTGLQHLAQDHRTNGFAIRKETGTHADVLAVIGAADVLRHLEPHILSFEDRFEVHIPKPLTPADLRAVDPGFPYFLLPEKKAPALPPERIVALVRGGDANDTGAAANRQFSIIRRMKAYAGPNQIVLRFLKMKREDWEGEVWESFYRSERFEFSSPLVQLFNPQAAKGYAFLKPTGTNRRDRTKDRWANPFVEWLRFRGYFEGSAGWFAGGDLRLFCPVPTNIHYEQLTAAAAGFRALSLGGSAVKIDCRAVLGLTRLLIETAPRYVPPGQSVGALCITHYKDMGQAHTVMAMEQLALPDWFELRNGQQAQRWLQTLKEHDVALRRLNDSHSDELAVVQQYRRTLQTQRNESIAEFAQFLAMYGRLLFQKRAKGDWQSPQFTFDGAAGIVSGRDDAKVFIENQGVLALITALRSASLGAQAVRHTGKAAQREIQYGLLSNICQAGEISTSRVLEAVRDFVVRFNRESAVRRSRGIPAASVHDRDWEAFAAGLTRTPSNMNAGALLCGLACCVRRATSTPAVEAERFEEAWA